jgi:hypothetical protein
MSSELDHRIINAISNTLIGGIVNSLGFGIFEEMHRDAEFRIIHDRFWTKSNLCNNYRKMHGLPKVRKQIMKKKYKTYIKQVMYLFDCSFEKAIFIDSLGPTRFDF